MNRDDTIKIARAVRNYPGGIGELTLVWKTFYSKLSVVYKEVSVRGDKQNTVPDQCVKAWLRIFIRDQSQLQPVSYYLVDPPTEAWRDTLEGITRRLP